jgi:plasmid stabilization system protein ParE
MVSEIIWSAGAIDTYNAIIQYLYDEWTDKEVRNFGKRVDAKLQILRLQPRIGRLVNKKGNVHRTLVHKKITLVYRCKLRKNEIELVTFWNNLQDPKRLKY